MKFSVPSITKKQVENNTYLKPLLDSAVRAIKKSSPFEGLQKHSYNNWKKILLTLDLLKI